jgi:hypothetical protein
MFHAEVIRQRQKRVAFKELELIGYDRFSSCNWWLCYLRVWGAFDSQKRRSNITEFETDEASKIEHSQYIMLSSI